MIWLILAAFAIELAMAIYLIIVWKKIRKVWTYLKAEYQNRIKTYDELRFALGVIEANLKMINLKDGLLAPTGPDNPQGGVPAAPMPPFPP